MSAKKLAVVGYLGLSDLDRHWVESVRASHDPNAGRVAPHFTLIFPAEIALDALVTHLAAVLASAHPFRFVLRRVMAVRDFDGANGGHVFLVPDEGAEDVVELHDRLYEGVLHPQLRRDIPFIPHVTVAASPSWEVCEALARELDRQQRVIAGALHELAIVEVGDGDAHVLTRFRMLDAAPVRHAEGEGLSVDAPAPHDPNEAIAPPGAGRRGCLELIAAAAVVILVTAVTLAVGKARVMFYVSCFASIIPSVLADRVSVRWPSWGTRLIWLAAVSLGVAGSLMAYGIVVKLIM